MADQALDLTGEAPLQEAPQQRTAPAQVVADLRAKNPEKIFVKLVRLGQATQDLMLNPNTPFGTVVERLGLPQTHKKYVNNQLVDINGPLTPAYILQDGDIISSMDKYDNGNRPA